MSNTGSTARLFALLKIQRLAPLLATPSLDVLAFSLTPAPDGVGTSAEAPLQAAHLQTQV